MTSTTTGGVVVLVVSLFCTVTNAWALVAPASALVAPVEARLTIDGTATEVSTGREVAFSGVLRCRGAKARATGDLGVDPDIACRALGRHSKVFSKVDVAGRVCAQEYGGPQEATVRGRVDGTRVDVAIHRRNSCGISDWKRLQWLLGKPDRRAA